MPHFHLMSHAQHTLKPPQMCALHHIQPTSWFHHFPPRYSPRLFKNSSLLELLAPRTCHELQSLQGKDNFLRHILLDYTTQAHGFLHLLHQSIPFTWDTYSQESFDALK